MKITKEHYEHLKVICLDVLSKNPNMAKEYTEKRLSAMRYRWDVLHMANNSLNFICSHLYKYLDDTHIDTALRSIIK